VGTVLVFFLSWLVMYLAGMMVLEVSVASDKSHSFISMAEETLGEGSSIIVALLYAILLYSLLAAYFSGGADLLHGVLMQYGLDQGMRWLDVLPVVLLTSIILYGGAHYIDGVNRVMVIGLIAAFFLLLILLVGYAPTPRLSLKNTIQWGEALDMFPIILTAFGYQVVIPSIRHYCQEQTAILPRVILIGSLIPFILYMVWALLIYSVLPTSGDYSIYALARSAQPALALPNYLSHLFQVPYIGVVMQAFAFFALASSLLGIALSLFDLLSDKWSASTGDSSRLLMTLATIMPPVLFISIYPEGFLLALRFAGVFVAILNGLLPVAMIWKFRRLRNQVSSYSEKLSMLLILAVSFALIIVHVTP
jgi:tyrosine-specific transport protein